MKMFENPITVKWHFLHVHFVTALEQCEKVVSKNLLKSIVPLVKD